VAKGEREQLNRKERERDSNSDNKHNMEHTEEGVDRNK